MTVSRPGISVCISEVLARRLAALVPETTGAAIRPFYSGKFMFGANCFGIEYERQSDLMRLACRLDGEEADEFLALQDDLRIDSLGLGIIAYYPGHRWPDTVDVGETE